MTKPWIIMSAAVLLALAGCRKSPQGIGGATVSGVNVVTISLPTLKCNTCVSTVKRRLASLEGIESAEIHLEEKNATVKYLPAKLEIGKIETEISKAGYDANDVRRDSTAYENLPECCK